METVIEIERSPQSNFHIILLLTRGSPMDSCHGNPSPSDPMESVCRHFPPPHQLYFAVYLLSLLRTDSRQSNGFLPPQPVKIGSDGVRFLVNLKSV